nr:immunoglobulin heavy chain junction region [Mus musculus]MBK4195198.1 immunoglobulin heavy chain junction region [Mus musculus]
CALYYGSRGGFAYW